MRPPLPNEIVKVYPPRGPLNQYRLSSATAFQCFRCTEAKKSKLVSLYRGDWEKTLCNGCYGFLLSVWEVKAGQGDEGEKADALADLLLKLYGANQTRELERLYEVNEQRAKHISDNALRFVATSEHLAKQMSPEFDWSPVVIGLCKAVETEIILRFLQPLAKRLSGSALGSDIQDKDMGRVAKFLAGGNAKPPELGSFAHFLQTALNSVSRRESSAVVAALFQMLADWPRSAWLSDRGGFHAQLIELTREFRNKAAHTELLTQSDYEACRELVIGREGMLWRLSVATQRA